MSMTRESTVPITACDELGRSTRCYVSGYQRSRVHQSTMVRGESRCLVADFNGAWPTGQLLVSATWRCWNGYIGVMSNARIATDQRSTAVDLLAAWAGCGILKCEATTGNGETFVQMFRLRVRNGYWFQGDPGYTQGTNVLTVTAPVTA